MLGAKYEADGDKISSLSGQNGSIVEGKSYNFIQNLSINTYMDEISADGGTMIFQCNANKGRAVSYEGTSNSYKVIYSTFVFGGIREESARNELMKIYMDYLVGTTPIVEEFDVPFTINNNTISFSLNQNNCLNFSLAHPARVTVDFYNISGQLVKQLINNSFNEGTHQVNLNSNFNNVSSGEYILNFKADEEVANQIIVISK